jgi:hypothetical protein
MIDEYQGPKGSAAEEGFTRWRMDHPRGFVINCASPAFRLHRAKCSNLNPDYESVCMTSIRKVCSEDRGELEAWAESQGKPLYPCMNCLSRQTRWELIGAATSVALMLLQARWSVRRDRRA